MGRRIMLCRFLFGLLMVSGLVCAEDRLNVLLIISDDLRTELNCYGADHMVTPNIDRLARDGTLFERAYVQQAVCCASRASFLTGLRPDSTGSDYPYSIYTVEELIEGWAPTFPRHFYNEGYYVRTLGKIHHWGYEEHFTEDSLNPNPPRYADPAINTLKKSERPPYERADVPDETYKDGMTTAEALRTLGRMAKQEKPFFLGVGLFQPHLPWCAPEPYWALYDEVTFPLSPNPGHPEGSPEYSAISGNLQKYKLPESPNGLVVGDEDVARTMKMAYAASVSFVDGNVGKLLAELDRLGLRESTVVMLISDHGWHLGDQDHWGKSTVFENATRAPLIISAPGVLPGQRTNALVEYVDVFPTLCEIAGIPVPEHLEGNSVVPLLKQPDRAWKSAVFSQYPRGYPKADFEGYSIRTDRYRYVQWRELDGSFKADELYDHQQDPHESISLAGVPDYAAVVETLKQQLDAGWKAALPEGIENHSNNPPAPEFVPWGPEARFGPYAPRNKEL